VEAGAAFRISSSFTRSGQLGAKAVRHAIPAICPYRDFAAAGGLMSYGTNTANQLRQVGVYTSRILKGGKPADLPVPAVRPRVSEISTPRHLAGRRKLSF
jgi:ABC-type uncharacterized transport system substrate-binding protein